MFSANIYLRYISAKRVILALKKKSQMKNLPSFWLNKLIKNIWKVRIILELSYHLLGCFLCAFNYSLIFQILPKSILQFNI